MQVGKLPFDLLSRLLAANPIRDPRVLVGPAPGEDAAAIDMGDRILVAKSDPITFATDAIGWYAVNVNANDVATMGAVPRWFLASVLLPEGASESLAEQVFADIVSACEELDIALVGGHTEITYHLPRPMVVGCLLGEAEPGRLLTSSGAQPGDTLILTKGVAVEGTAILAREARPALETAHLPRDLLARAAGFLRHPGISVVKEARIASQLEGVHALHDPTEGGLITGLRELAVAAKAGLLVNADAIPIFPETQAICSALNLDPLGLIASGSLLVAVSPEWAPALLDAYHEANVPAAAIGKLLPPEDGCQLERGGRQQPLPVFDRDEIARYFSEEE